jgi:hypothetical protein
MPNVVLSDALRARGAKRGLLVRGYRRAALLVVGGLALAGWTKAWAGPACQPTLTIKDVHLSEMRPPTLERKWTATVVADAARCATTAGYFEVGISRLKEYGPELDFREQFVWSAPAVKIGIDFAADEAVYRYWIDSVQACPCAGGPSR